MLYNSIMKKENDAGGGKGPFDIPMKTLAGLALGNLLLGYVGYLGYVDLGAADPGAAEAATLACVDVIALWMRWKLPKTWQKLTGEAME